MSTPQPRSERQFIHDLATPLGVVFLLLDGLIERERGSPIGEQLSSVLQRLHAVRALLKDRREELIQAGELRENQARATVGADLGLTTHQYERFFTLTLDMACICGFDGYFKVLNPSWEKVLGHDLDTLRSRPFVEFVHPDDRERTAAEASRLFQGGVTTQFENRYRCADGTYRWISWRSTASIEHQLIYAIARDVTEQREIEEKIRLATLEKEAALHRELQARSESEAQRERLLALLTQMPALAAIFAVPGYRFLFANPSYREMIGGRDPVGKALMDIFPGMDPKVLEMVDQVAISGERFVGRDYRISADWVAGGPVLDKYFTFILEPVRDRSGKVDAVWLLAFEVTENQELQGLLRATERMASLGTLAAGVAHEINNPLGYALANLSMAIEELSADGQAGGSRAKSEVLSMLSAAESGMHRVREIGNGLRAFSRNDERRVEPVDVIEVIKTALPMVENEIRHRATPVFELGEVPRVLGNPGRLAEVILNLLVNAAQAINEGAADRNVIAIVTCTRADGQAVIRISDTGCGIPSENVEKIFDPFFTTKPQEEGTGLGLFICQGIVNEMKGSLVVKSEVGRGTTFELSFPPAPRSEDLRVERPREPRSEAPAGAQRRLRILVIDDEVALGNAISRILGGEHDVVVLADPRDALELVRRDDGFDVILCDLMMPTMSGMDVFENLRAMGSGLEKRIVLMTGGAFTARCNDWLKEIPNRRLEKPFSSSDLRAFIGSLQIERDDEVRT